MSLERELGSLLREGFLKKKGYPKTRYRVMPLGLNVLFKKESVIKKYTKADDLETLF